MCYNIDIMKKILVLIIAIILIPSILLTFAACGDSFSKTSIMAQIDNNLGWHEGGTEILKYDVVKGDVKIGQYTSIMESLPSRNVEITTSSESVKPTLNDFKGYKFSSEMTLDDNTFKKVTVSYASYRLEPKLSYTMTQEGGKTVEIVTSYETKKSNVTFIVDGNVISDSAKYSASAFVVDNSFLYQFARATTLSSALSIVVPTYSVESGKTQNTSFTCSYSSSTSVKLSNKFVLNQSYSQSVTADGETTVDENTSGYAESESDIITSEPDENGNTTKTYKMTLTNSIPVVRCTFATTKTFPASGSISCMIATSPMKAEGEKRFVNRVVVSFAEGDIRYNLTSVKYTTL